MELYMERGECNTTSDGIVYGEGECNTTSDGIVYGEGECNATSDGIVYGEGKCNNILVIYTAPIFKRNN
jgi:hypothetical protein